MMPSPRHPRGQFDLARVWNDPSNWRFGILYRAPHDPRLLVPMRFTNAAFTPNIAHAKGAILAGAAYALAAGPFIAASLLGRIGENLVTAGAVIWLLALLVPIGVWVRYGSDASTED